MRKKCPFAEYTKKMHAITNALKYKLISHAQAMADHRRIYQELQDATKSK